MVANGGLYSKQPICIPLASQSIHQVSFIISNKCHDEASVRYVCSNVTRTLESCWGWRRGGT